MFGAARVISCGSRQSHRSWPYGKGIAMALSRGARVDRMLRPVHRWVWGDFDRRVRKLLAFAEVEGDGGRDILRAAEVTTDPLLRRLYLEHAIDELPPGGNVPRRGAGFLSVMPTR